MQSNTFELILVLCEFKGNHYIVAYGKTNSGLRPIWALKAINEITKNAL